MVRFPYDVQVLPPSMVRFSQMTSPGCAFSRRVHAYWTPLMSPTRCSRGRPSTPADWTVCLFVALTGSTNCGSNAETDTVAPQIAVRIPFPAQDRPYQRLCALECRCRDR